MFSMWLLCFLFIQSVCSYDVTTVPDTDENTEVSDLRKNTSVVSDTKTDENKTVLVEKITQPSQTQQIERALEPLNPTVNSSLAVATKKESNLENFRPSPQLETYYEYNKFPVKPALPEPKTFGSFHDAGYSLNSWTERPVTPWEKPSVQGVWSEDSWKENVRFHGTHPWTDTPTTTQSTWVSHVKFPTTSQGSADQRPYKFVTNDETLPNYPSVNFPATTEGFAFNKPVETPTKKAKPPGWFWDRFVSYDTNKDKSAGPNQKTFFDYNMLEKPPQQSLVKEPGHGMSMGSLPWQKIVKILTTVIPIGLLISALTPTVITVTSMNDTQSRYRSEIANQGIANRLASSLTPIDILKNGRCEDKILCELLVSASTSKDSEKHIENLLNTFTQNEDLKKKKDDLLKIFEAVRNEDCSSIVCKNIRHPT